MTRLEDLLGQLRAVVEASKTVERAGLAVALKGGPILAALKREFRHGTWLPEVERMGLNKRKAQKWMRLFRFQNILPSILPTDADGSYTVGLDEALEAITAWERQQAGSRPRQQPDVSEAVPTGNATAQPDVSQAVPPAESPPGETPAEDERATVMEVEVRFTITTTAPMLPGALADFLASSLRVETADGTVSGLVVENVTPDTWREE